MRRRRRRILLAVALALTLVVAWDSTLGPDAGYWHRRRAIRADPAPLSPAQRPAGAMRVLFVGNSFTSYWGGQALIGAELAMSAPDRRERPAPIYEQTTQDGFDLREQWEQGDALRRIREGNWDIVVLQDHSEGPLRRRDEFFRYSRLFDAEARKIGARTILFMTWSRADNPDRQAALAEAYHALGRDLGVRVVPVGLAFGESLRTRPGLILHEVDGKHPSRAGSYLTGCCFYGFLYGRSPRGLRRTISDNGGVEWLVLGEADANFLQDLAYRVVTADGAATAATTP